MEDHPKQVLGTGTQRAIIYSYKKQVRIFSNAESMIHKKFSIASHVVVYDYINVYRNQSVLWEKKGRHKNNVGRDLPTRKKRQDEKGFTILPKSLRKPALS
jgi:hypothetical protein